MPKFRRSPQVVTRLTAKDMERFRELAVTRGVSHSSLLREAALFYLDHYNQSKLNELEGIYAQQLKASTNRICAMLAKIGIDNHAIYQFLSRIDDNAGQLMQECTGVSAKRLTRSLAAEEQAVASSMTNKIMKVS